MKKYDIIVIGSGCGLLVVEDAAKKGWKTALVEKGQMGGTCLNVGCIPSKMLIYPADVINEIKRAKRLGIDATINSVDFKSIIERTFFTIEGYRKKLHRQLHRMSGVDLYEDTARFSGDYTLEVSGETITAPNIVIACGTRPVVPDGNLVGQEGILTSDNLLELQKPPETLVIIGGGYVACEYAHFFSSMGSRVTVIEMADRLLSSEEPEVSELVEKTLRKDIDIHIGIRLNDMEKTGSSWKVNTVSVKDASLQSFEAGSVLIAMGRRPNTDLLAIENTSIEIDKRGYIRVDEYLSTNLEGIYAIGDVNGVEMFRHAANYEAQVAWHNCAHSKSDKNLLVPVDYHAMPRAIFTRPQVAAVGMTQSEAEKNHTVAAQTSLYYETAKGEAMQEKEGFIKVVVNKDNGAILGCHIAGPHAPVLIQEVVNAMAGDGTASSIFQGIHIHPALSELVPLAFSGF